MYLGSNKQDQVRYHGRGVAYDNQTIGRPYTPLGAVSPNGSIMPDFGKMSPNAPAPAPAASGSGFDFNKLFNFVAPLGAQALQNSLDLKIAKLNLANQTNYIRQQQLNQQANAFQSFAAQNPTATSGTPSYAPPPPIYASGDNGSGSSVSKYIPYMLAGAGLLIVVSLLRNR